MPPQNLIYTLNRNHPKRNLKRNIILRNPPYNCNPSTNIGEFFLNLDTSGNTFLSETFVGRKFLDCQKPRNFLSSLIDFAGIKFRGWQKFVVKIFYKIKLCLAIFLEF